MTAYKRLHLVPSFVSKLLTFNITLLYHHMITFVKLFLVSPFLTYKLIFIINNYNGIKLLKPLFFACSLIIFNNRGVDFLI